jgi:hypothetical protein
MSDRPTRIRAVPQRLKGVSPEQLTEEVIEKLGAHIRRRVGSIGDLVHQDASGFGVLRITIEVPLVDWEWGIEKIDVHPETHYRQAA